MPTLTKTQLAAENEALRAEVATLRHLLAEERSKFIAVTEVATAINRTTTVADERRRAMEAAKQAALSTGRCVKVQTPVSNAEIRRQLGHNLK